ncbi:proton-coupled folate transporter-like [Schistocerca americana]|uniref:proton-coupled folate transporter-like n=1 Tax=Schistocerca americana TaxID=7009 RepID=UPI001F4F4DC7|nr:proton-coupled folate transporter-like [Schistocerca americana]XP_049959125.1 proton-coupled folate transporter-like [Schistocerca serialis cubense]
MTIAERSIGGEHPVLSQRRLLDCTNAADTGSDETGSERNLIQGSNEALHHQGRRLLSRPTVEPAVFLFLAASAVSSTVTQTLFLQRVCEEDLGYNATVCSHLDSTNNTSEQPHTASLLMSKTLLETLLPATLTLFLGPWSDRHGRKPLLLFPLIGHATTYAAYAGLSTIDHLPPRYLLPASIPIALTGGFIALILSSYSYIADVSHADKRGLRLSLVEVSVSLSAITGNAVCAPLYKAYGFVGIFTTAAGLCLVGFFYVLFLLPESITPPHSQSENTNVKCVFLQETVVEVFKVSFKWRPNYGRAIVLLAATALSFYVVTLIGEGGIMYLYTIKKFGWTVEDYTRLSIAALSMSAICTFGTIYIFVNVLHFSETLVAAFGFVCKIISALLAAFSPYSWYLYLAALANAFGGICTSLIRSTMSKTVPPSEVGSVFSLTAALESVMPLVASPLYTAVYNATIASFAGAFYLMSAVFYTVNVGLSLALAFLQRKCSRSGYYEELPSNDSCPGSVDA